ncbi:pilus assembly protein TadE [Methylobacterium sp. Leaf123]|uniref:TadE/TadG family type IV pilus assembly protein n=1 Tax=Methylobacterium sp. Leaf123 TaxID=1736264 RepID=UPI0006FC928F|nr:TadE/TadG family type IV pilus assembly protein [Methylobacterium sp. Leaf123]KQQ14719.1 pilus assembly protein TadE [Methylobacterium sp. Leaf123]
MAAGSPRTPLPAPLRSPALESSLALRTRASLRRIRAGLGAQAEHFRAAEGAVAAIEFALILPTLLLILFAGTQVVAYIDATRKVELVAHSISQMISQSVPPDNSTVARVNATDLHFAYDATLVLFPYVMKDAKRQGRPWWQNISINYASIQFKAKNATCQSNLDTSVDLSPCYDAKVVWTTTGTAQPGGNNYRPCDTPQLPSADDAASSRTTLPRSTYGPGSLVVIDVAFDFTPTFGSGFVSAVRIARSAYVQPRYASLVSFDTTNNDGIATKCTGY